MMQWCMLIAFIAQIEWNEGVIGAIVGGIVSILTAVPAAIVATRRGWLSQATTQTRNQQKLKQDASDYIISKWQELYETLRAKVDSVVERERNCQIELAATKSELASNRLELTAAKMRIRELERRLDLPDDQEEKSLEQARKELESSGGKTGDVTRGESNAIQSGPNPNSGGQPGPGGHTEKDGRASEGSDVRRRGQGNKGRGSQLPPEE